MAKYIIKRLLLAVLILFGVSIILFFLVRLMPVNFIVNKFSSQMALGGIKPEDLQLIMKSYGYNLILFLDDATVASAKLFPAISSGWAIS